MSWFQTLGDLGVAQGLLGSFHAESVLPELAEQDRHVADALNEIARYTQSDLVAIGAAHEPGRIIGVPTKQQRVLGKMGTCTMLLHKQPACGVLFNLFFSMEARAVRTICIPVCDHAVIALQIVDENDRVLSVGAARVTPDRLCGDGSIVAAIFEAALRETQHTLPGVTFRFHLSAGCGPCCMKFDRHLAERMTDDFKQYPDLDFQPGVLFDKGQLDMLAILAEELRLRARMHGVHAEVFSRDRDCTVCCSGEAGAPYYTRGDTRDGQPTRYNLYFFSSSVIVPRGSMWRARSH